MDKQIVIIVIVLLMAFPAKSQITQEHDYPGTATFAYLEGTHYYSADYVNNTCTIFDKDHTVESTVNLNAPADMFLYEVAFVSQNVFNPDDLMELLVVWYNYIPQSDTGGYYVYSTQVVDQNGSVLLDVPGGGYSNIIRYDDGQLKLMVSIYDFENSLYATNTLVYWLPGELNTSEEDINGILSDDPFPNPAHHSVNIPYNTKESEAAELILVDMTGQTMNRIELSPGAGILQLNTKNLTAGQYVYYIESSGRRTPARKIIVR